MALQYETGTPSSPEDLIDKLQTFAALHGWTVDNYDASTNKCSLHSESCYVHFGWADSGSEINICQSLGFVNASTAIDAHTDDSGNGSATIGNERRCEFDAAGPYTSYHFFADDATPRYIHVVVEVSSGIFRHFGFGTIVKFNDWTGGEYAYGNVWIDNTQRDNPRSSQHTLGLDGVATPSIAETATMHLEDIDVQGVSEKWGIFYGGLPSSAGTDSAGEARRVVFGNTRGGGWAWPIQTFKDSALNSYVPIAPIAVFYVDRSQTPDVWIYLGYQQNVGVINIDRFAPGDEVTLGGETWKIFPWVRKQFLEDDTIESWNAGLAYRKS